MFLTLKEYWRNVIRNKDWKTMLIGLGLDNKNEHKRFTKGHNFCLIGGSEDTHKAMQEKSIKFNELLKERRKTLDEINNKEFYEIADKVGLRMFDENKKELKS